MLILEERCCGAAVGILLVKLVFFCSAGWMGHLLSWCMCLGFCREWSFQDCGCCYPVLLWWSLLLLSWPQAGANGKPPLDEGAQGHDGATSSTDNRAEGLAFSAAHSSGSAVTEPEEFEVENEIVAEVRLAFCAWTHMWWWLFLRGGGGGGGINRGS